MERMVKRSYVRRPTIKIGSGSWLNSVTAFRQSRRMTSIRFISSLGRLTKQYAGILFWLQDGERWKTGRFQT